MTVTNTSRSYQFRSLLQFKLIQNIFSNFPLLNLSLNLKNSLELNKYGHLSINIQKSSSNEIEISLNNQSKSIQLHTFEMFSDCNGAYVRVRYFWDSRLNSLELSTCYFPYFNINLTTYHY